ncbi:MAG: AI-2E family transporter [Actinomycetota bacterium]|nr:AI-2E family transporter [Actinomycetota bacterium]
MHDLPFRIVRAYGDAVLVASRDMPLSERVIRFRARTVLAVLGIVLAVAAALQVLWLARHVLTWIFVALFLALALNPLVEWLQRRGIRRRGLAAGVAYLAALLAVAGLSALFIPTLVDQVNEFVEAIPGYVDDLTRGRGRLGFLQTDYQIVDRIRDAIEEGGAGRILGFSGTALAVTRGVVTIIVATVTIVFMTFFMLLEGPAWVERFYSLIPEQSRDRWRAVGNEIYRTVGGYVFGNLLISVIAGAATAIVLTILDVPYSVALGLLVAILDLIPLAGATLAAIIVSTVAILSTSLTTGIIVIVFFLVYQQLENHLLQPVIYGRTVQLSPLAVLIAVLIGAELAGILGALGAIPIAGTIQVLLRDWLRARREHVGDEPSLT